jgi:hypothetical protein
MLSPENEEERQALELVQLQELRRAAGGPAGKIPQWCVRAIERMVNRGERGMRRFAMQFEPRP